MLIIVISKKDFLKTYVSGHIGIERDITKMERKVNTDTIGNRMEVLQNYILI